MEFVCTGGLGAEFTVAGGGISAGGATALPASIAAGATGFSGGALMWGCSSGLGEFTRGSPHATPVIPIPTSATP